MFCILLNNGKDESSIEFSFFVFKLMLLYITLRWILYYSVKCKFYFYQRYSNDKKIKQYDIIQMIYKEVDEIWKDFFV